MMTVAVAGANPASSRLDNGKLRRVYGLDLPQSRGSLAASARG